MRLIKCIRLYALRCAVCKWQCLTAPWANICFLFFAWTQWIQHVARVYVLKFNAIFNSCWFILFFSSRFFPIASIIVIGNVIYSLCVCFEVEMKCNSRFGFRSCESNDHRTRDGQILTAASVSVYFQWLNPCGRAACTLSSIYLPLNSHSSMRLCIMQRSGQSLNDNTPGTSAPSRKQIFAQIKQYYFIPGMLLGPLFYMWFHWIFQF